MRIPSDTPAGLTDHALLPPRVVEQPGRKYAAVGRRWQGIPTIERTPSGRLWMSWYSGGIAEDNDNYCILVTSDDDGATWSDPVTVVDPHGMARAWDPCLWHDPAGTLWWTWTQTAPMRGESWDGRGGVWAMTTSESDSPTPTWSAPRRLFHGVALNKPIFRADDEWLLPVAVWKYFDHFTDLNDYRKPGVIASADQGKTWQWRGGTSLDDRVFDEPMIVSLRDNTLWMLMRTQSGISESFSMDGGTSWSCARPSMFAGPSARFHFRRLASGRLLLINHLGNPGRQRSHLTAMLSDDEGRTWPARLLLDDRMNVSYPDAVEGPDGTLWIAYDRDRYGEREVLMAVITEQDVLHGRVSSGSRLKVLVNRAGCPAPHDNPTPHQPSSVASRS